MPLFRCGIGSPPPLSTWAGKTSRNICKSVREEFPFPAWACACGCTHLHTCCLWWNMSLLLAARGLGERAWGDCKLGWLWSSPSPTHSATRSPTHPFGICSSMLNWPTAAMPLLLLACMFLCALASPVKPAARPLCPIFERGVLNVPPLMPSAVQSVPLTCSSLTTYR